MGSVIGLFLKLLIVADSTSFDFATEGVYSDDALILVSNVDSHRILCSMGSEETLVG